MYFLFQQPELIDYEVHCFFLVYESYDKTDDYMV